MAGKHILPKRFGKTRKTLNGRVLPRRGIQRLATLTTRPGAVQKAAVGFMEYCVVERISNIVMLGALFAQTRATEKEEKSGSKAKTMEVEDLQQARRIMLSSAGNDIYLTEDRPVRGGRRVAPVKKKQKKTTEEEEKKSKDKPKKTPKRKTDAETTNTNEPSHKKARTNDDSDDVDPVSTSPPEPSLGSPADEVDPSLL